MTCKYRTTSAFTTCFGFCSRLVTLPRNVLGRVIGGFVLSYKGAKYGGGLLVKCTGKTIEEMAVTLGKPLNVPEDEQRRITDVIVGAFSKADGVSSLKRDGE